MFEHINSDNLIKCPVDNWSYSFKVYLKVEL